MGLFRTGLATSAAVVIRMLSALMLGKVLAVSVGPAGFAVIGQFQNLMSVAQTFAAGALGQGVTKYTAEDADDERRVRLWRTAGTISLFGTAIVSAILILASERIADLVLFGKGDRAVIVVFALSLLPIAMNGVLLAILNGLKEIRLFVWASIAGSLCTMAVTSIASWQFGLRGALFAFAGNQAIAFLATLALCWRQPWFLLSHFFGRLDPEMTKGLGKFILMALTTAATAPIAQAIIRNIIVDQFSLQQAGYWDIVNRLSILYMMFFTSVFSVYYLPKLSEIGKFSDTYNFSRYIFRYASPVLSVFFISIYFLRNFIIDILFDNSFSGASDLFLYQSIGDFFKLGSWIFAYVMIAKAIIRPFIILEVVFNILLIIITYILGKSMGFGGVSAAYALNYFLYGVAVLWVLQRKAAIPGGK